MGAEESEGTVAESASGFCRWAGQVCHWGRRLLAKAFKDIGPEEIKQLLWPGGHSQLMGRRRAVLIISRVRMVAAVFAILTPLWLAVDCLIFPWPLWGLLGLLRAVASLGFAIIAFSYRFPERWSGAMAALLCLLTIPTVFFAISQPLLHHFDMSGVSMAVAAGYAFLPFIMVAGLSVFPITASEGIVLPIPLILATLILALYGYANIPFNHYLGAMWLLMLLVVVAVLAGMSQLHFMMALVNQTARDRLTRTLTRPVGEELLTLQFSHAERCDGSLSLAFVDLDNFKAINDRYGHDEGDRVLHQAAQALQKVIRRGDMVVRWGGEEFLIILPGAGCEGALSALERLRRNGLGTRPDGSKLTASIGIAERREDGCDSWQALIDRADRRMYVSKQSGKDRICTCGEEMITG